MNESWKKRSEFAEVRKTAMWIGLRVLYPKMSDAAIADLIVEMCDLSERTRYHLYHESRKYRVKKMNQRFNRSDDPTLPL